MEAEAEAEAVEAALKLTASTPLIDIHINSSKIMFFDYPSNASYALLQACRLWSTAATRQIMRNLDSFRMRKIMKKNV